MIAVSGEYHATFGRNLWIDESVLTDCSVVIAHASPPTCSVLILYMFSRKTILIDLRYRQKIRGIHSISDIRGISIFRALD